MPSVLATLGGSSLLGCMGWSHSRRSGGRFCLNQAAMAAWSCLLMVNVGNAALLLREGGSLSRRPYPQPLWKGLLDLGRLGRSPYPAGPWGCTPWDVLLTQEVFVGGGDLNSGCVLMAAGTCHCQAGGCHTRLAHCLSGLGGVGVDIVARERGGSEVSLWNPQKEDSCSDEKGSDLLDVCDGEENSEEYEGGECDCYADADGLCRGQVSDHLFHRHRCSSISSNR